LFNKVKAEADDIVTILQMQDEQKLIDRLPGLWQQMSIACQPHPLTAWMW